ncbi:MAG: phage tail protein [Ktedonobacteraceae bacterium]|jgi:phage tail-like protein
MAGRDNPYVQFNFLVQLDDGADTAGPDAGFQEVSGIGMEITISEYRNGNDTENHVRKVNGLNKSTDVTLKRGIIGTLTLYNWLNDLRYGQQATRTVTIKLLDEEHNPVFTWTLSKARIIKHTSGPLSAKGADVAMEEMVIAYEKLEMSSAVA